MRGSQPHGRSDRTPRSVAYRVVELLDVGVELVDVLSLTSYRKQVFLVLHDNVIQDERVAVSGVRVVGFPEQRFAGDALGVGELRPGKGACYSLAPALAGILETVAASNRVADKVDHKDQMARRGGIESARGLVIAREIRPRLLEAGEHVVEHGAVAAKGRQRSVARGRLVTTILVACERAAH